MTERSTERSINHSAGVSGPMEHAGAEYPVVQRSSLSFRNKKSRGLRGFPASKDLERAKGFEPSTPTLARLCSTPELRPPTRRRDGSRPAREGRIIVNPTPFATLHDAPHDAARAGRLLRSGAPGLNRSGGGKQLSGPRAAADRPVRAGFRAPPAQ